MSRGGSLLLGKKHGISSSSFNSETTSLLCDMLYFYHWPLCEYVVSLKRFMVSQENLVIHKVKAQICRCAMSAEHDGWRGGWKGRVTQEIAGFLCTWHQHGPVPPAWNSKHPGNASANRAGAWTSTGLILPCSRACSLLIEPDRLFLWSFPISFLFETSLWGLTHITPHQPPQSMK